jgi:hypothetical protein
MGRLEKSKALGSEGFGYLLTNEEINVSWLLDRPPV